MSVPLPSRGLRSRLPRRPLALALVALAQLAAAAPDSAHGHTRSLSYSSWRLTDEGARVRVRIPRLELTRVGLDAPPAGTGDGELARRTGRYLAERLALVGPGGACRPSGPAEARSAQEGWAAFSWDFACPAASTESAGELGIETAILLDVAPSHLHFARFSLPNGRVVERVLTEATPHWTLPAAARNDSGAEDTATASSLGASVATYVGIGVQHILTGWDHLAFVLALLLLAGSLGEVARVVTGFTLAHSLTLALAVLGFVHPDAAAVEAVIGFSVALVAAENAWALSGRGWAVPFAACLSLAICAALAANGVGSVPAASLLGLLLFSACHFALLERAERPARVRAALAFAFGLVHGFGFAGVLGEMQLPTERLAPALFGFNVGVELGQLAVVALAWPALRLLARPADGRWHRLAVDAASAAICGIGVFWFVARAFGAR